MLTRKAAVANYLCVKERSAGAVAIAAHQRGTNDFCCRHPYKERSPISMPMQLDKNGH